MVWRSNPSLSRYRTCISSLTGCPADIGLLFPSNVLNFSKVTTNYLNQILNAIDIRMTITPNRYTLGKLSMSERCIKTYKYVDLIALLFYIVLFFKLPHFKLVFKPANERSKENRPTTFFFIEQWEQNIRFCLWV